jgi:hypothetical protein
MNERIQELYQMAVKSATAELREWNNNWQPSNHNFEYEKVLYKKFAELIVRECARRSYLEDSGNPEVEEALEFWRKDMLKHFGVEE